MTVAEMITKLGAMIAADPSVASMQVDAEGCDCIELALDVYVHPDWQDPGIRRLLVARSMEAR